MRKFAARLFILLFFSFAYRAQAQNHYRLTVKEAVDLAFKNLTEVKNAELDVQIQQAQNKEITGSALPQLSANASISRYLQLPKILFPDGSKAGIYDVLKKEKLVPDTLTIPAPTYQAVSFFQPWNTNVGATLSQLLFQPDVFVGLKARQASLNYSEAALALVKEQVKDSAYRRYYAILIAEKQATFLQSGIERLQKLYHDDSIMFKNGFAERLDLDKVEVQLTNLKTSKIILDNSIRLAYAALKYSLGLPQADSVVLSEQLSNEAIKRGVLADSIDYSLRKEYQLLGYMKRLQQLNVKRYQMGYLPTLSASLGYTIQGLGQKFITDPGTIWFRNSLIALNFNLPLFDGLQRKYKIQQEKLSLQKVDNNIENLERVIDLQQTISKESLTSALLNLDAQERNVQLAENVYNTTKKKFEAGLGSSFEVLTADNDWQTAQSNYFTGLYNAIIAKIAYQSALGKLD